MGAKAWPGNHLAWWDFPCDWRDAESCPNWVWSLNCPFRDLTVTELPSTDWRLFPANSLQSPEFNSPKSITARREGAWLTRQPQTAQQLLLETQSIESCRTINFDCMLPNGLSSNMVLREHYCFCHAWKMHVYHEIVLWKHLASCLVRKYECIVLYQNRDALLNCQK